MKSKNKKEQPEVVEAKPKKKSKVKKEQPEVVEAKPKKKSKVKKALIITSITLGSIVGVCLLTVGSYVAYVYATYSRLGDQDIEVNKRVDNATIQTNTELKYTSYNIGFGAYEPNYNFFLDYGNNPDGTVSWGHYSKGLSKESTMANTLGSINELKKLDSDFIAVQEVDTKSNRAYFINQKEEIEKGLTNYDSTFACNYHSAFLAWPLYDMHGASDAGIVTLSKYNMKDAKRHELTVSDGFDKFFDLDRCFSTQYIDVANGKKLCLVNIHMSAYDEGGYIRNKQVKEVKEFLNQELVSGNYVLAAGDFNHDLLSYNPLYKNADGTFKYTKENRCFQDIYKQKFPEWCAGMHSEENQHPFGERFQVYADDRTPTCRSCGTNYEKDFTFVSTLDGFIASDNIEISEVATTDVPRADQKADKFGYSDHQPTTVTFKLKA